MQLLSLVIGFLLFIGAVFIGGIVLAGLLGLFLIAALIVAVRVWWLKRQLASHHQEDSFVEAEYQVINTRTKGDDQT